MTRYFYPANRAHHAKCMALDFGMVFHTPEDDEYAEEVYTADNLDLAFEVNHESRVYIHPDSMHLLVPKRGDEILWMNPRAVDAAWRYTVMDERPVHPENTFRILTRDGKPFISPEVEL